MWNWAKTRLFQPLNIERPPTVAALRALVTGAAPANRRIRPLGSIYSFSDCIYADDIALDTSRLKKLELLLPGDARLGGGAFTRPATKAIAWAEAGVTVDELCKAGISGTNDFAPFTLGGSSGQALVGAISTSTHGGDFEERPLPEYVLALHLITGQGDFWFERPGPAPVVNDAAVAAMLGVPQANIGFRRGANDLDAVLVSCGAAGAVASVLFELRDDPLMNERVHLDVPWTKVRAALANGSALVQAPGDDLGPPVPGVFRYLEILMNPYDVPGTCIVCARNELPKDGKTRPKLQRSSPDVVSFALDYFGMNPHYSASFEKLIEGARLTGPNSFDNGQWVFHRYTDVINTGVPTPQPVHSFELVWDVNAQVGGEPAYLKFLDRAFAVVQASLANGLEPYGGTLSLRFTRGTSALLGMQTSASPATARFAHLEISPLQNVGANQIQMPKQNRSFLTQVFSDPSMAQAKAHWGQGEFSVLALDANTYGGNLATWKNVAGAVLGSAANKAVFQNAWTQRVGLVP